MRIKLTLALLLSFSITYAQKVIPLYPGKAPGSESWTWKEKEMYSDIWQTQVVYNVSEPTLTVYPAPPATANGTSVIIAPGGGFAALSINSEGIDVAKWLNTKGVTAFVLKYRLNHTNSEDPVKELMGIDRKKRDEDNAKLIPMAIADGMEAVKYVRAHASEFGVDPGRIGLMGFSAGGTVAAGTAFTYTAESRPDFVAPVYAYTGTLKENTVPADAPPIYLVAATDDQLGLAPHSVELYNKWMAAGKPAELHMYTKGGHGFGMRRQYLPSDTWIDRFGDWLEVQGLLIKSNQSNQQNKVTPQQMIQRKRESEERFRNDWANLKRYQGENKKLQPLAPNENRVVFMGNSITEGWKRTDSSFFYKKPYVCRGISGQTTPQMLIRFRQDVIDLKPKVVVILAGINDIAQNTGPITLEETMGNIASMATLAKSNGIKVVLSSVLPAYDFPWRPGLEPAEKVITLNKMIKEHADKNGYVYLDYFTSMVDNRKGMKKEYAYDEVHPTLAGYKVMAPLAEKAIAEALKRK